MIGFIFAGSEHSGQVFLSSEEQMTSSIRPQSRHWISYRGMAYTIPSGFKFLIALILAKLSASFRVGAATASGVG